MPHSDRHVGFNLTLFFLTLDSPGQRKKVHFIGTINRWANLDCMSDSQPEEGAELYRMVHSTKPLLYSRLPSIPAIRGADMQIMVSLGAENFEQIYPTLLKLQKFSLIFVSLSPSPA